MGVLISNAAKTILFNNYFEEKVKFSILPRIYTGLSGVCLRCVVGGVRLTSVERTPLRLRSSPPSPLLLPFF